jgi:endoglucanase
MPVELPKRSPYVNRDLTSRTTRPSLAIAALAFVSIAAIPASPVDSTKADRRTETAIAKPFLTGVFLGDAASTPDRIVPALHDYSEMVGTSPSLVKTFFTLRDDFSARGWAGRVMRGVTRSGATNLIALAPEWDSSPGKDLLALLASGAADAKLRRAARDIAQARVPVLVELAWEMNGNWSYAWQGAANGNSAAAAQQYVAAWRHVVAVFRAEGATNVRWIFAPNVGNPLGPANDTTHWNWYARYYPGSDVVDYVGVHGFHAPTLWGGAYRDFATLFDGNDADRMLTDLAARYPDKPIIVGEFAAEETPGRDKGEWIAAAYHDLLSRTNVVGAVWFHMRKEADWRIDSSHAALSAYRDAMRAARVRSAFADPPAATHLAVR